jgi:hypothetical protein
MPRLIPSQAFRHALNYKKWSGYESVVNAIVRPQPSQPNLSPLDATFWAESGTEFHGASRGIHCADLYRATFMGGRLGRSTITGAWAPFLSPCTA